MKFLVAALGLLGLTTAAPSSTPASNNVTNNFVFEAMPLMFNNPSGLIQYAAGKAGTQYSCLSSGGNAKCSYIITVSIGGSTNVLKAMSSASSGTVNFPNNTMVMYQGQMKPSQLLVHVYASGTVFVANSTSFQAANQFSVVSSFVVNLAGITPITAGFNGTGIVNSTFTGQIGTSLNVNWMFQCSQPGMFGPGCNLQCQPSGACTNKASGAQFSCKKGVGMDPNQFGNCTQCPNGVNSGSGACQSPTAPPPVNKSTMMTPGNLVAYSYYQATVALAILFTLVILVLIGFVVRSYMNKKKEDAKEYARRRAEWGEKGTEIGNGKKMSQSSDYENKAYNPNPDPDENTDASDSESNYSHSTAGHEEGSMPASHHSQASSRPASRASNHSAAAAASGDHHSQASSRPASRASNHSAAAATGDHHSHASSRPASRASNHSAAGDHHSQASSRPASRASNHSTPRIEAQV